MWLDRKSIPEADMTSRRKVALASLLAFSFIACPLRGGTAQEQKEPQKEQQKEKPKKKEKKPRSTKILFIGGSFVYYNNLPDIFAKLALAGGAGLVETGMVALPGWSLKDHWQKGDAHKVLRDKDWNFVVLQDGSLVGAEAKPEGKPGGDPVGAFRPFARNWAQVVQDVDAVPVFFLTWARKDAPDGQTFLNSAYFDVAKEVQAKVAAVGIAWGQVQKGHPEIELYASDGVNPSPAGSYLAACAIYATMFGRNPEGVPAKLGGRPVNHETGKVESETPRFLVDLPPTQAKVLQQAAWAAKKLLDKKHGYLDVSGPPAR
jgi:hypothetical protein